MFEVLLQSKQGSICLAPVWFHYPFADCTFLFDRICWIGSQTKLAKVGRKITILITSIADMHRFPG